MNEEEVGSVEEVEVLTENAEGDLQVVVEEPVAPEEDPIEGKSDEDNVTEPAEADIDPKYKGKSVADVIEMHKNAESMASKKQTEIDKYKDITSDIKTRKDVQERVPASELKNAMNEKLKELEALDDYTDEIEKKKKYVEFETMRTDFMAAQNREMYNETLNAQFNTTFLGEQRKTLVERGIEFTDDDFSEVSEIAKRHAEDGRITDNSIAKAIIDKVGVAKYDSFNVASAIKQTREDLNKASQKASPTLDIKATKSKAYKPVKDLTEQEFNSLWASATPAEKARLSAEIQKHKEI